MGVEVEGLSTGIGIYKQQRGGGKRNIETRRKRNRIFYDTQKADHFPRDVVDTRSVGGEQLGIKA